MRLRDVTGQVLTAPFSLFQSLRLRLSERLSQFANLKVWKLSAKPSSNGRSSVSFLKAMRGHSGCIVAIRADIYKVCILLDSIILFPLITMHSCK